MKKRIVLGLFLIYLGWQGWLSIAAPAKIAPGLNAERVNVLVTLPFPPERFGVTSQRDREWLTRRLVPQPLRTFEQPLPAAGGDKLKRAYIYCSQPAMGTFDQFAERLRDDRKWTFHEVKTGHDAMVTAPGEIAKILLGR